jgi:hypothetical protein
MLNYQEVNGTQDRDDTAKPPVESRTGETYGFPGREGYGNKTVTAEHVEPSGNEC